MNGWKKGFLLSQVALGAVFFAPEKAQAQSDAVASNKNTPKHYHIGPMGRKIERSPAKNIADAEAIKWSDIFTIDNALEPFQRDLIKGSLAEIESDAVGQAVFDSVQKLHPHTKIMIGWSGNKGKDGMYYDNYLREIRCSAGNINQIFAQDDGVIGKMNFTAVLAHEIAHAGDSSGEKMRLAHERLPKRIQDNKSFNNQMAYLYQDLERTHPIKTVREQIIKQLAQEGMNEEEQKNFIEFIEVTLDYAKHRLDHENLAMKVEQHFYKNGKERGHYLFALPRYNQGEVGHDINVRDLRYLIMQGQEIQSAAAKSCNIIDLILPNSDLNTQQVYENYKEALHKIHQKHPIDLESFSMQTDTPERREHAHVARLKRREAQLKDLIKGDSHQR